MKYFILSLFLFVVACTQNEPSLTDNPTNTIEWINYFDTNDWTTYKSLNSMVSDNSGGIYFSAFYSAGEPTGYTDIYHIENNIVTIIDTSVFFKGYDFYLFKKDSCKKRIWVNNKFMFVYDENNRFAEKWYVSDLNNKQKSFHGQVDYFGNIWLTSENHGGIIEGLHMYNGTEWVTYFEEDDFWAICFDNDGKLYVSKMVDMDEKGIILSYDYNTWDTVINCASEALWIPCMHFDSDNNLWGGIMSRSSATKESGGGLFKYDGINVTQYFTQNSGLPSNSVIDVAIDNNNQIWVGTYSGGLAKLTNPDLVVVTDTNTYHGTWTIYNKKNTQMPFESIEHIAIDNENTIWVNVQMFGIAKLKE